MSARAALAHDAADSLQRLLPPRLAARLAAHCASSGDADVDVIIDAIELHLDEADARAEEARRQRTVDGLLGCIEDLP